MNSPLLLNICTRSFSTSATNIFPRPSQAIPRGENGVLLITGC